MWRSRGDWQAILPVDLHSVCWLVRLLPFMHDVRRGGCAKGGDGLFLGQGGGNGGDGDFLGAGFISGNNLNLGDAFELGKGGGDVIFAASADHAGHFGDVVDGGVCGHGGYCKWSQKGEKESGACHKRMG